MINIVTAPEHCYFHPRSLKVFLAGGIQKCIQWQKKIIDLFLENADDQELNASFDNLYLINPRRADWLDKEGEDIRQIEWEFDMLQRCDMFTMYFAGGESDQPICMYELGRYIERMKQVFPTSWKDRIVITCDSSYRRLKDVIVQTYLATGGEVEVNVADGAEESVNTHYKQISSKLKYIYNKTEYEF